MRLPPWLRSAFQRRKGAAHASALRREWDETGIDHSPPYECRTYCKEDKQEPAASVNMGHRHDGIGKCQKRRDYREEHELPVLRSVRSYARKDRNGQ